MGALANDYAVYICGRKTTVIMTCPWQDTLIGSYVL